MEYIWDKKFSSEEYLYGEKPNAFFKQHIDALKPGKVLLPGEGEGRNALYAAQKGWETYAFDGSAVGKQKAVTLAEKYGLTIHYDVAMVEDYVAEENSFDLIALVFLHLPSHLRKLLHAKLVKMLKPGGLLIMEVFEKKQIHNSSGGPKKDELLYSVEELKNDFTGLEIENLAEVTTNLNEGGGHQGEAIVLNLVATK